MKDIYIIRHGQTDFNKQRIIQGSGIDSDLNEEGRLQAQKFFDSYGLMDFEVVLTSKLKRTHQTVRHFIDKNIPWEQWKEINEMSWGIHEGRKGDEEMKRSYAYMIEEWSKHNYNYALENGESAQQLGDRIQAFIDHLPNRKESKILVCSHGRAMRCLMALLKGEPLTAMEKYKHSNTGLYQVKWTGTKFEFVKENDTTHLG